MKNLQTNLGRAYIAHDLAHESACKLNVDILIVAESNKKIAKKRGWLTNNLVNVAVYIRNPKCGIESVTKREDYIIIKFKDMTLISCYISPNIRLEEYKRIIGDIFNDAKTAERNTIIADINVNSPQWGRTRYRQKRRPMDRRHGRTGHGDL